MIRRLLALVSCNILLGSVLFSSLSSAAATQPSVGASGLQVTPVRTELSMTPGQTETVPIYVTDESNTGVTLQVIINDFTSKGDSGTPSLILNGSSATHGLKQFISPVKNVSLAPQQQLVVPITVSIPKNTLGGGYFAAVRFAAAANSTSSENVSLSASVASLILVQVNGPGISQQLNLSSFQVVRGSTSGHFFIGSSGLKAVVRFNNIGNVQEAPYGKVVLKSGNKTVMVKEINSLPYPSNILPGSVREFGIPLKGIGQVGKYQVSGYFGYAGSTQLLSTSANIYVVSTWIVIVGATLAIIILASIIWLVILLKKRIWPAKPTYATT